MSLVKNLVIGNTSYPIRDANTYQSITEAQEEILGQQGKYNGSDVDNNTIFTKEDGTFIKFEKELVPPGSYETVSSSLYGGGSYAFTTDTTIVRTGQLGYSGGWAGQYVGYSEDNGYTWGISTLDGSDLDSDGNNLRRLCAGKNSEVYGLRVYSNLYHTKFIKSVDGGKTFTSSTVINTTNSFGFLGYLKTSDVIVAVPLNSGYAKNETLYSTDGGQTFQEFNTYNTYGTTIYRIGKFDDDTIIIIANNGNVYTTTNWTTWAQIGSFSLGGDQWAREWDWRTTITKVGDYFVFRGSFNGGKIAYSDDEGVTWALTQSDFPEIEGCGLFDYSEGLYIAVKSGTFYTSTDLLSGWESHDFMSYNGGADYGTENCSNLVHFNGKTIFGSNDGSALIPMSSYYLYSITQLSYNKTEVDDLISGKASSLDDIATSGEGIDFKNDVEGNYTITGTVLIDDGIAHGYKSHSTLELPRLPELSSDLQFIIKYHHIDSTSTTYDPAYGQNVICADTNYNVFVNNMQQGDTLQIWDGNAYQFLGNYILTNDETYWLRAEYNGTSTIWYILPDNGNDYTLDTLPDISSGDYITLAQTNNNVYSEALISLGNDLSTAADSHQILGSIDLNESIITSNGDTIWEADIHESSKMVIYSTLSKVTGTNPLLQTDGSKCSWRFTHNKADRNVLIQIFSQSEPFETPIYTAKSSNENYCTIEFPSNQDIPANTYKIIVL